MRATITLSATLALLLAACSDNREGDNASGSGGPPEDRFTVRAGPVPNAQLAALSGTFQMHKSGAPDAIASNGRGGACLVFAPADLGLTELAGRTCTSNQNCHGGGASAGYCAPDTGTCWVRPASDPLGRKTCNRPITMTPANLNPVPAQPLNAGDLGIKADAKVRIVACLNKLGASPTGTGCGSINGPDRIEVFGPVATVK